MKVYLTGRNQARQEDFVMCVAPAATIRNQEIPAHWLEHDGKPSQLTVVFNRGEAEVEDDLGHYLLSQNVVKRTRLVMPRDFDEEDRDPPPALPFV